MTTETHSTKANDDAAGVKPPLRIGVMVDSLTVPNWIHRVIDELQNSDYAHIELVVLNGSDEKELPVTGLKARLTDIYKKGVYNRYVAWDYARYQPAPEADALAPRDATDLLESCSTITVQPKRKKFTDRFEQKDVEEITGHDLDVVLRFGFRIIRGEILKVARYGVWSYHHGDNREYRGGPALFWEIAERNPVSGIVLQVLSDELDGGRVIYRSTGRTELNSLYANRNPIFWKGSTFVPRRLQRLHRDGWESIEALDTFTEQVPYEKGIYRTPTSPRMLMYLARRFWTGVQNKVRKTFFQEPDHYWFTSIRKLGESQWNRIACSRDRYFADPFLFEKDGKTWLFAEELPYATGKGLISVCEVNEDATTTPFQVIMDEDVHLSYPAVFEHDGEYYMTPETADARQIRLYRATDFPHKWELAKVLLDDVDAADPTIFKHEGKLYLFANMTAANQVYDDELHLFIADELMGPWAPHPMNPIVSDVKSSRPAGHLYYENGELIRPAQDCSVCYGYAMTLHRVTKLSPTEYREEQIEKIMPDWNHRGLATHTTNRSEKFEVRDGQVPFYRWRWEK